MGMRQQMHQAPQLNHSQNMQYSSASPVLQYQTTQAMANQTEHQQMHAVERVNATFAQAFEQMDKQLGNGEPEADVRPADIKTETSRDEIHSQEPQQESQQEHQQADESADLSEIAKTVIGHVETSAAGAHWHTASKVRASNFMALMEQLSTRQVRLEDDKFVDTAGDKVETDGLRARVQTSIQRGGGTSQSATPLEATSIESRANGGLEDPFDYMLRTGASDQTGIPNSLEAAKLFAPSLVKASDWEEDYHGDSTQ